MFFLEKQTCLWLKKEKSHFWTVFDNALQWFDQLQSSTLWLFHSLIIKQQRLELLECMNSSNTDNIWVENTKVWRDAWTRMTSIWIPPMMRLLPLTLPLLLLMVKRRQSTCSTTKQVHNLNRLTRKMLQCLFWKNYFVNIGISCYFTLTPPATAETDSC